MKKAGIATLFTIAIVPPLAAWIVDADFSSGAHVPVIGVSGIAVALCDALFGQIVALTRDLPFQSGQTPAQTDAAIEQFESFHCRIFGAWILAKCMGALAVILSAVTVVEKAGMRIEHNRQWILLAGYVALGIALSSATFFFSTYRNARRAAAKARRSEISRRYVADHEWQPTPESEAIERRRDSSLEGYNSKPEIIG